MLDNQTKQEQKSAGSLPCQHAALAVQKGVAFGECFNALESLRFPAQN
jgi:hypothetical protein